MKFRRNHIYLLSLVLAAQQVAFAQCPPNNPVCNLNLPLSAAPGDYKARDAVQALPGATAAPGTGQIRLYTDPSIQLPLIAGNVNYSPAATSQPVNPSLPVGSIAGEASVNSAGQAVYTIPVQVPPGTRNMTPSLALSYNSGAEDGLAGRGWNLQGISKIMRVSKDHYHDGFREGVQLNSTDPLALDGNRLIPSGALFRLENDNFSTITSTGNSFQVETKEGMIMHYGGTPDSRLELSGPSGMTTYCWYLSRMEDKFGNFISWHYGQITGNNEIFLKEIRYTGNQAAGIQPYNTVRFHYDVRQDIRETYLLGIRLLESLILREIVVECEGRHMKKYSLEYGYNNYYLQTFLNSITEQGSDYTKLNCTFIKYGEGIAPNPNAAGTNIQISNDVIASASDCRTGDFNGDGKTDIISFEYNHINPENGVRSYTLYKTFYNQGSNTTTTNFTRAAPAASMAGLFPYSHDAAMGDFFAAPRGFDIADFDGDGKDDIVLGQNQAGNIVYTVYKSTGTGFFFPLLTLPPHSPAHSFAIGDFNGDGLPEFAVYTGSLLAIYWMDGTSTSAPAPSQNYRGLGAIDFDGDGRNELITTRITDNKLAVLKISLFGGTQSIASVSQVHLDGYLPDSYSQLHFGDFNGDGITDNIKIKGFDPLSFGAKIRYGSGTGFVNSGGNTADDFATMDDIADAYQFNHGQKYLVADINHDGKSDLVSLEFDPENNSSTMAVRAMLGGTQQITMNEGPFNCAPPAWDFNCQGCMQAETVQPTNFGQTIGGITYNVETVPNRISEFLTGDFNGDARQDILFKNCNGNRVIIYFDRGVQNPSQLLPTTQLVSAISDGFRNQTIFRYETLANTVNTVYTRGNSAQYPTPDFQRPVFVVRQIQEPNGIGSFTTTSYRYESAHLHMKGKGFLGFDKIIRTTSYPTVPPTSIVSEDNFLLDGNYFIKLPTSSKTTVTAPQNQPVSESLFDYDIIPTLGLAYYTRPAQLISKDLVSGKKVTEDFLAYDGSGNTSHSRTTIGNINTGAVVEEAEVVSPYVSAGNTAGILNVPGQVTTTVIRPQEDPVPYIRTVAYSYNPVTGVPVQTVQDPGKSKRVQTNMTYDPATGLLLSTQISDPGSAGPITRTTQFAYDNYGRFIVETTNPIGQKSLASFDSRWGKPLTETGVDGLTTSYKYDGYGRPLCMNTPDNVPSEIAYDWAFPASQNPVIAQNYPLAAFNNGTDISSRALFSITIRRPGSPVTRMIYDRLGREIATESEGLNNLIFRAQEYDARGNVINASGPFENVPGALAAVVETTAYDLFSRPVSSQKVSANITLPPTLLAYSFPIPANGSTVLTITAPDGKVTEQETDGSGLLQRTLDNAGNVLAYNYYSHRQLKETVLNGTVTNSMQYDEYGMQSALSDPGSFGTMLYEYDAYGRLVKQTDAKLTDTYLNYDLLDRIIQRTLVPQPPAQPEVYAYSYVTSGNGINQIQSLAGPGGQVSYQYTYDGLGRLTRQDENIDGQLFTTAYAYDQFSNLAQQVYPSGFSILNEYDTRGHHIRISRGDTKEIVWELQSMNALGQHTQSAAHPFSNAQLTDRQYNDLGYPERITAGSVFDMGFDFDLLSGNLNWRRDNLRGLQEDFTYDALDRLTDAQVQGQLPASVSYAPNGNILSKTGLGNYQYHPARQLAVEKVDNTGLEISPDIQDIVMTPFHKTAQVREGDYQLDFLYGPDESRRRTLLQNLAQSTTQTRYFSGDYELTIGASGGTGVHYIRSAGGLEAIYVIENGTGQMYYPHTDHLGSLLAVSDDQGNIAAEQSFDAWGRYRDPATWVNFPTFQPVNLPLWLYRGFTGHEHLSPVGGGGSALINMNGRMYDPLLGRMLSPDNNLQQPDLTQNHNRYSYALNNPLRYVDPSGNDIYTFDETGKLILVEYEDADDRFQVKTAEGIKEISSAQLSRHMEEIYRAVSAYLRSGELSNVKFNSEGFYIPGGSGLTFTYLENKEKKKSRSAMPVILQPEPELYTEEDRAIWQSYGMGMEALADATETYVQYALFTFATWEVNVLRLFGRAYTSFMARMGWNAAGNTSSRILSWGSTAKGHLIKHADALGFGNYSAQQLQKMLPQLRSAANQLYNNINPKLTRIGNWPGQKDQVLMHITNNGKMLVTKSNGEFVTVINKTSNAHYLKALPFK